MKKIIAAMLLFVMMVITCACGNNGNTVQKPGERIDAGAMVLVEMGTVPDGVTFISGGIVAKYEGKGDNQKVQVLNQSGASFNDKWYGDVDSIISNGICVVSNTDTDGKELLGVVDSLNEKELLPCEAVEVVKLSERFLLLGYMTGVGTSEDRFGTYYIDSESVDYKGYGKVLDLEKGQVVSDVEIKTSKYDVSAAGNMIFVEKDYHTTDVYTAEGKLVGSYEDIYAYPESSLAMQYTAEGICVYDKDMKLVSTLEQKDHNDDYKPVDGTSEMLLHTYTVTVDNALVNRYCVTDLNGKALTAEYARILSVYPDGYLYISENETSCVVDFNGNTIVSGHNSLRYVDPGFLIAYVPDEGYYAYDREGNKINGTAMEQENGLVLWNLSPRGVLIWENGEMLTVEDYPQEQTGSLVLIDTTLYDVISGKTVLTDVDSCVATGGNLYVWDSEKGTYTRYVAEFKSEGYTP